MQLEYTEIQDIPLFRKIQERDIPLLLQYVEVIDCPTNSSLMKSGTLNDTLFVVLAGKIQILSESAPEKILLHGEYWGVSQLFLPRLGSQNVQTLTTCRLLTLNNLHLRDLASQIPSLGADILLQLAEYLVKHPAPSNPASNQDLLTPSLHHFENSPGINRSRA